jgi:hypothetical protein
MQTDPTEVPSDEEFDQSLLELLATTKHQLYTIHGELLDKWYEQKDAGPIIIFAFARMIADDYAERLEEMYPHTTVFSLYLDATGPETASYMVIMSHINFAAIAMFGQELTPEEFAAQLEFAKVFVE